MKKISKLIVIVFTVVIFATLTFGCTINNTKPEIDGVKEGYTVSLGDEFNALAGVSAKDLEEGDITSKIDVTSIPAMTFTNGKATPTAQGDYEIIYKITDKDGLTAEAFSTLTVKAAVTQETLFKTYDFTEESDGDIDTAGWEVAVGANAAGEGTVNKGRYEISVTNKGTAASDIVFKNDTLSTEIAKYKVVLYMSSSSAISYEVSISGLQEADKFTPATASLNTNLSKHAYEFAITEIPEGEVCIKISLGNGSALESAYNVYIEKAEILITRGFDVDGETVFERTAFTAADSALIADVNKSFGFVTNLVTTIEAGALKATVPLGGAAYDRMVWLQTNKAYVKDTKYKFTATVKSNVEQSFEFNFGDYDAQVVATNPFNNRDFPSYNHKLLAGTNKLEYVIKATQNFANLTCGFQLGGAAQDNVLEFTNIKVIELDGDQATEKEITRFIPYNDDSLYNVFNGTDEDLSGGVGTIYKDTDAMVYHINEVGDTGYYNKFFINKLSLEAFAYYRFEIKVKSNVPVKAMFMVNKVGAYDPIILESMNIGTDYSTVKFTTNKQLSMDIVYDLIFEFGGADNKDKGEINVSFAEINIYKMA